MQELPSRGRCYAAFLLAYSFRLKPPATLEEWIAAALNRATIMAAATDIPGTAHILLAAELARLDDPMVLDERLLRVSARADQRSFVAIARLCLAVSRRVGLFQLSSTASSDRSMCRTPTCNG